MEPTAFQRPDWSRGEEELSDKSRQSQSAFPRGALWKKIRSSNQLRIFYVLLKQRNIFKGERERRVWFFMWQLWLPAQHGGRQMSHQASPEKSELQVSQEGLKSYRALSGLGLQGCDRCDINQLHSLQWRSVAHLGKCTQSPSVVTHQRSNPDCCSYTDPADSCRVVGRLGWEWHGLEEKGRDQNTGTSFLFQHPLAGGLHSHSSHHPRGELRGAVVPGGFKSPIQQCFKHSNPMQLLLDRVRLSPPCLNQSLASHAVSMWVSQCFLLSHFTRLLPLAPFPSA